MGRRALARPFTIIYCAVRRLILVAWESAVVLYLMRRMPAGLLDEQHPWVTGRAPDGAPMWPRNIVYRSRTRRSGWSQQRDDEVVSCVGRFLAAMVRRSVPSAPELPQGPKRRMPHAVNYLHGAVHYNGAFLVFDDFPDLVHHLTSARFRRDLLRFGRRTHRELTLVFRERRYDPLDFAYCVGCVRAHLPWFANGNGPDKTPVLWGNASPYPVIALIHGAWMADTLALARGERATIVRPSVTERDGFAERYEDGTRHHTTWFERYLAWAMFLDVRSRGFRGQLFFTDRRKIEPHRLAEYHQAGGYWSWVGCHPVPHPFKRAPKEIDRGSPL